MIHSRAKQQQPLARQPGANCLTVLTRFSQSRCFFRFRVVLAHRHLRHACYSPLSALGLQLSVWIRLPQVKVGQPDPVCQEETLPIPFDLPQSHKSLKMVPYHHIFENNNAFGMSLKYRLFFGNFHDSVFPVPQ